jgi:hypothetical protein
MKISKLLYLLSVSFFFSAYTISCRTQGNNPFVSMGQLLKPLTDEQKTFCKKRFSTGYRVTATVAEADKTSIENNIFDKNNGSLFFKNFLNMTLSMAAKEVSQYTTLFFKETLALVYLLKTGKNDFNMQNPYKGPSWAKKTKKYQSRDDLTFFDWGKTAFNHIYSRWSRK